MADKSLHEMNDAELRAEWAKWDEYVRNYPSWGAALVAADGYRRGCEAEMTRRGMKDPRDG